jgi:hypothetical protein
MVNLRMVNAASRKCEKGAKIGKKSNRTYENAILRDHTCLAGEDSARRFFVRLERQNAVNEG